MKQVFLDNLPAEGKVKPMIVAMESSAVGGAGMGGPRRGGGPAGSTMIHKVNS
jgi:hypothetical protein